MRGEGKVGEEAGLDSGIYPVGILEHYLHDFCFFLSCMNQFIRRFSPPFTSSEDTRSPGQSNMYLTLVYASQSRGQQGSTKAYRASIQEGRSFNSLPLPYGQKSGKSRVHDQRIAEKVA
jgi:hypothetical protein